VSHRPASGAQDALQEVDLNFRLAPLSGEVTESLSVRECICNLKGCRTTSFPCEGARRSQNAWTDYPRCPEACTFLGTSPGFPSSYPLAGPSGLGLPSADDHRPLTEGVCLRKCLTAGHLR